MKFKYTFPKRHFTSESIITKMHIFFKNGDFLQINEAEIIDISLRFYDRLIFKDRACYPVVESGFIKLKISPKRAKYESYFLYNMKEYIKSRKTYIEKRLCGEGEIDCVRIFNQNNFQDTLYGDIFAVIEDDFLVLKFKSNELYGSFSSDRYEINLGNVLKKHIDKINFDFENCESFEIFQSEIIDIQLDFDEEMTWNANGFIRKLKSGFIRLRFDEEIGWRNINTHYEWLGKRTKKISHLIKRLCGKGKDSIDICHLYITYEHAGYGIAPEECIDVPQINCDDYDDYSFEYNPYINIDYDYDEDDEEYDNYDYAYISGYAEKQNDGSVLIVFGKEI